MSNTSWSTMTPSAFSPSTTTMRTVAGVIDTPSTISIAPPSDCYTALAIGWEPVPRKPPRHIIDVTTADHLRRAASTSTRPYPVRSTLLAR